MKAILLFLLLPFVASSQYTIRSISYWGETPDTLYTSANSDSLYRKINGNYTAFTKIKIKNFQSINQIAGLSDSLAKKTDTSGTVKRTFLANDVANAEAVANTLTDVTGLSFPVISGNTYRFKFFVVYTSAATTTGSRWVLNGAATTFLNFTSQYTLTATSITNNAGVSAYNSPSAASASSLTSGNIAILEGIIKPSANGTVQLRFASEVTVSAITAKAGQSYVEYQQIN